jgi:hypothetical protein
MSEQATTTTISDDQPYWRLAAVVMGFGFMISMAAHLGGPGSATASPVQASLPNQLAFNQQQAQQQLTIGGFDTIGSQPAFVILNEQGQRVGTLPMNAAGSPD